MKIGDLVMMTGSVYREMYGRPAVGVIVRLNLVDSPNISKKRIGIMWHDGDRVDWEPVIWLEVISESR